MPWLNTIRGSIRAFLRDERGASTVEYALTIGPFLFMLFAVFQIAYTFFLSAAMDSATQEIARQIRTGGAQASSMTAEQIIDNVCTRLRSLTKCDSNVYIDARVFDDFSAFSLVDPIVDGEVDESQLQTDFGQTGEAVLVRLYLVKDTLVPDYLSAIANMSGSRRLFIATAAFRNEPF